MGIPQVIMIILIAVNLTIEGIYHGTVEEKEYNFFAALIGKMFLIWMLVAGDFFN